jgi:hypothetical protein
MVEDAKEPSCKWSVVRVDEGGYLPGTSLVHTCRILLEYSRVVKGNINT